jgi:hypothetical protein
MIRTAGICLLLAIAVGDSAAETEQFRFHKDIDRGAIDKECLIALPFDGDVYEATRDGFPDLRILDDQNRTTPYLIEQVVETQTHTVRRPCPCRVVSPRERADGLQLTVELDKDAPAADGITIVTPLVDYERRVRITGSPDGMKWTPRVENGRIFDYSRYIDVANREIKLPKNTDRRFLVFIDGLADMSDSLLREITRRESNGAEVERIEKTLLRKRPFRIDRIEMWCDREEPSSQLGKKAKYPVAYSHTVDKTAGKTVVYFRSRREPLTELTLETLDRNFSRVVRLQAPVVKGTQTDWTDVAQGRIRLLELSAYRDASMRLSFPERREKEYRIVIDNQDSPPIRIKGAGGRGPVYQAVFLASPGRRYRLVYGSEEARPPRYDAEAVLAPLRAEGQRTGEAKLGSGGLDPAAAATHGSFPRVFANPVVAGVVISGLVILLGWALYQAAHRINRLP